MPGCARPGRGGRSGRRRRPAGRRPRRAMSGSAVSRSRVRRACASMVAAMRASPTWPRSMEGSIWSARYWMCAGRRSPVSSAWTAAPTAPQDWWPRTSTRGISSSRTPYATLPRTASSSTSPAERTVRRSPSPWSKTSSGGTRESTQPRTSAKGCWARVSWSRTDGDSCGCSCRYVRQRRLPAISRRRASSGVPGRPAASDAPGAAGTGAAEDGKAEPRVSTDPTAAEPATAARIRPRRLGEGASTVCMFECIAGP